MSPKPTDEHESLAWSVNAPDFSDPACADPAIDPDIFFPFDSDPAVEAREICRRCPHVMECAEFAMRDLRILGVWGGLTWTQRKDLKRQIKLHGSN